MILPIPLAEDDVRRQSAAMVENEARFVSGQDFAGVIHPAQQIEAEPAGGRAEELRNRQPHKIRLAAMVAERAGGQDIIDPGRTALEKSPRKKRVSGQWPYRSLAILRKASE